MKLYIFDCLSSCVRGQQDKVVRKSLLTFSDTVPKDKAVKQPDNL